MIEKPSLFFSFDPHALDTTSKVHKKNLTACKDDNQKITYVFHAVRTKNYGVDLSKNGMNLLGRVQRAMSYLYNSVVLFLFWKTVSGQETKKVIQEVLKPPAVQSEVVIPLESGSEPAIGGDTDDEVQEEQDFGLSELDQAKWLCARKFLSAKKFTEDNPLIIKIDDTVYHVRGDDKRVCIEGGDEELTVSWKPDVPPVVLNIGKTIKPDSDKYTEILKRVYDRTPEGIIESDAIPKKNKPCPENVQDTEKLDFLLNYLLGDHAEDPKRLLFKDDKDSSRSVRAKDNNSVLFCNASGEAQLAGGKVLKQFTKQDGLWKVLENGMTRDLKADDKISIQQMVTACNAYTYSRASKQADALSSQIILGKDQWSLMQRVLNSKKFCILGGQAQPEGEYVIWRTVLGEGVSQKNVICIQHQTDYTLNTRLNRLDIHVEEDGTLTVRADGGKIQTLTEPKLSGEGRAFAEILYRRALKESSRYTLHEGRVQINTVHEGVGDIAVHHFSKVVETLQTATHKTILPLSLQFQNMNDGINQLGIDAGGLGRDFMVRIFSGLLSDPARALKVDYEWETAGLPMPKAGGDPEKTKDLPLNPDEDLSQYFSKLTDAERVQYQNVGYMQMYCFRSDKRYVSGQIFHADAFAAIQSIPYALAKEEMPGWTWKTWFPVIEKLASKKGGDAERWVEYLKNPTQDRKNAIVASLRDSYTAPEDWPEAEVSDEDVETYLKQTLMEQYSRHLPALHAMAHGMMKRINKISEGPEYRWLQFCAAENVQDTIQGVLDRDAIGNFQIDQDCNDIIRRKVTWLQEWIQDQGVCPESTLKLFLRFITGASSIPPGVQLRISRQGDGQQLAYPKAHTCFGQMELSDLYHTGDAGDDTKEKFIQRLLEAARSSLESGFAMA